MLDLISFFTRIPSRKTSLEKAAKKSYLLPLLGGAIGLIVGIFSILFFRYFESFLAAVFTVILLYSIVGLNHLDGLADFADGLYTPGTKKRKIEAMKDVNTGVAGIIFVLFDIIFLLYAIFIIKGSLYLIIVAEISAKTAMVIALFFGKPMKSGIGKIFLENFNKKYFPFSIILSLAISFGLLRFIGLLAIGISIICSLILVIISQRKFGIINGDIIGAINELSRIVTLFVFIFI